MEIWQLVVYVVMGFIMAVLSGIAGAGGGFIMTPLLIFLGLSPAQAVATGKIGGLSVTIGSLSGLRGHHGRLSKRRVIPVMLLSLVVGLVVPYVITTLDIDVYRIALGVLLILMIPVVLIKKVGIKPTKPGLVKKGVGGMLLTLALFLQGTFSGGLGTLVNVVLMGMLGMTALEANITKRWSQVVLNAVIVVGVFGSGLIQWPYALAGAASTLVGGYIGGRMAVHKGDRFIINTMVVMMFISGIALIVSK